MEGTLNIKAFRKRTRIEQLEITVAGLKSLTEAQLGLLMKYRNALQAIADGREHPTDIAERILTLTEAREMTPKKEEVKPEAESAPVEAPVANPGSN